MNEKKQSVYASIAEDILSKIKSDTYKIGSLLPPERALMQIYSVQRTTVRRGLEILNAQGYIQKAAGLGSVVKSKVPCENEQNTKVSVEKVTVVEQKSSVNSLGIIIGSTDAKVSPDKLPSAILNLIVALNKQTQSGIFYNGQKLQGSFDGVISIQGEKNLASGLPHCCVLTQSDDDRSVILDSDKAAYYALTYLEELGHSKFAFIGTDSALLFQNAFYDSFSVVNSNFDEELVNLSGETEKAGFDGFSELFRRHGGKFTSVVAANDDVARGIIKAAKYYKVSVPEELSVISLCSTDKKADFDRIYFDCDELASEVLNSVNCHKRISTVLFSGLLIKGNTAGSVKTAKDDGKNISSFLL